MEDHLRPAAHGHRRYRAFQNEDVEQHLQLHPACLHQPVTQGGQKDQVAPGDHERYQHINDAGQLEGGFGAYLENGVLEVECQQQASQRQRQPQGGHQQCPGLVDRDGHRGPLA
ncbi:hypothetical protein D3C79_925650 [compost metagenome]